MMNKNEFANYIADNIKNYLPPEYKEAEVQVIDVSKNNDITLTGLNIRRPEEEVIPTIYIDGMYEKYVTGAALTDLVSEAASTRIEHDVSNIGKTNPGVGLMDMLHDYDQAKENLVIFICNTERNQNRLRGTVRRDVGEFSEVYRLCVSFGDNTGSVAVSPSMLKDWGISVEQLHADAIAAENKREPYLMTMHSMLDHLMSGGEPVNMLKEEADPFRDDVFDDYLYVLTTADKTNGAHLMLRDDVLAKAGDIFGENFYVLPSSVHEVLLTRMSSGGDPQALNEMVKSINGDGQAMNPVDILSDNAYAYDRKSHSLMNTRTGVSIDLRKDGSFIHAFSQPVHEIKTQHKPKKKQSR